METVSGVRPRGDLRISVSRDHPCEPTIREILRHGFPHLRLSREVFIWRFRNLPHLARGLWRVALARLFRLPHYYGCVWLTLNRGSEKIELGLASLRVVTTAGVGYIVDAFQNSVELENMKYHGFGTGSGAENIANTALTTELTTEYATDNTRPTGSQTEGGSANVYRTVATLDPDAAVAITEHGIFSQAANSGGVLLDKSLFSAVNLGATGDTLAVTYDFTVAAGS